MKNFKEIAFPILEGVDIDENGIIVDGDTLQVRIHKAKYNNLMEIVFSGNTIISHFKSNEAVKDEYADKDHDKIDKMYLSMFKKFTPDVVKLVKRFEKDLNSIVLAMEKDTHKY